MTNEDKAEIIKNLVSSIDDLCEAHAQQEKTEWVYNTIYQSRANIKEYLALLFDVELN